MGDCLKTYGKKDLNSLTKLRIENFCASLGQANKHKSKKAFLALPIVVQCMFLHHGHQILSDPKKHSKKSYQQAFNLFKIFQGEGGKDVETYKKYRKFVLAKEESSSEEEESSSEEEESSSEEEEPPKKVVKKASPKPSESSDDEKPIAKPKKPPVPTKRTRSSTSPGSKTPKRTKKTYDKEYQKFEEPPDDTDPLYIFYTSLYEQKPKSRLAITWLTEHGVYDGDVRETLVEKYKKLAEKGELIK